MKPTERLTATLGTLMAETGKMQTYDSTITALLTQSVKLPKETLIEVENFIKENKHLGYVSREEFINEAIRFKLEVLRGKEANQALKGLNARFNVRMLCTNTNKYNSSRNMELGSRKTKK